MWSEFIMLSLAVFMITALSLIIVTPLYAAVRNLPNKEIRTQFKDLVRDIEATPNKQENKVGFAVNKEQENYQLVTKRACLEGQKPEKDNCPKKAKICLIHINKDDRPICEEIDNGNFLQDNDAKEITPIGISITIKKDANGMISLI